MSIDFSVAWKYLPTLLHATLMTIALTLISQAIGTAIGFLFALGRVSSNRAVSAVVWTYVWVFRGTPMLLHLFFVYYAAPLFGVTLDAFPAAIIAMSISSTAYNTEIFRAGIQSIHRGQIEAAQAVGIRYPAIVRRIILPQALRVVAGPYMSNFISHTKGSSLASAITVPELMFAAQTIYSTTYRAVEILSLTGLIYLALTSCLTGLQMALERYLAFDQRGLSKRRRRQLLLDSPAAAVKT